LAYLMIRSVSEEGRLIWLEIIRAQTRANPNAIDSLYLIDMASVSGLATASGRRR